MSVLFVYGFGLLSHGVGPSGAPTSGYITPVPSMSVGTAPSGYGPDRVTDGVSGLYSAANEMTAAYSIDLGSAKTPQLAAVFNHNIDGTVRVQGSNSPTYSSYVADVAMTAAHPNFWTDLSALGASARYWRISVTGNSVPIKIGEIVIGRVTTLQTYQWDYINTTAYLERGQGVTDYGGLVRTKRGIAIRQREVRFVGPDAIEQVLRAITRFHARRPWPVVVVPDHTGADVWLVDWPDTYAMKRIIENRCEVTLVWQEQSPGLLSAGQG